MSKTIKYRLTCSGSTFQWKETLKARRWSYDPASKTWYVMLVEAHAERVRAGDADFLKGLGGQLKGCRLCLDGIEVWRSKTYENAAVPSKADRHPDQDGFGWNCDAAGNRVASVAIAGSSPDDRV